jgi:hypothetical protein
MEDPAAEEVVVAVAPGLRIEIEGSQEVDDEVPFSHGDQEDQVTEQSFAQSIESIEDVDDEQDTGEDIFISLPGFSEGGEKIVFSKRVLDEDED